MCRTPVWGLVFASIRLLCKQKTEDDKNLIAVLVSKKYGLLTEKLNLRKFNKSDNSIFELSVYKIGGSVSNITQFNAKSGNSHKVNVAATLGV